MLTAKSDLTKIIFLKIETTTGEVELEALSPLLQECFIKRFSHNISTTLTAIPEDDVYIDKAPLSPEFGRIISISWGIISDITSEEYKFSGKTISGVDELQLLSQFAEKMNKLTKKGGDYEYYLCGYALKGFDIPFLSKRMLINGLTIPKVMDNETSKPWELVHYIDLFEAWKMTSWDSFASLETLCALFKVELSTMDASNIHTEFYNSKRLVDANIIGENCEKKVLAMANLYLRLKGIKNKVVKSQ